MESLIGAARRLTLAKTGGLCTDSGVFYIAEYPVLDIIRHEQLQDDGWIDHLNTDWLITLYSMIYQLAGHAVKSACQITNSAKGLHVDTRGRV